MMKTSYKSPHCECLPVMASSRGHDFGMCFLRVSSEFIIAKSSRDEPHGYALSLITARPDTELNPIIFGRTNLYPTYEGT